MIDFLQQKIKNTKYYCCWVVLLCGVVLCGVVLYCVVLCCVTLRRVAVLPCLVL